MNQTMIHASSDVAADMMLEMGKLNGEFNRQIITEKNLEDIKLRYARISGLLTEFGVLLSEVSE